MAIGIYISVAFLYGKEIKYDAAGNPISYDGKTYEWTGKQLTKVTAADGTYTTYNYDANGLRTKKCQYDANNELQYQVGYLWSDGKIVTQSLGLIVRGTSGGQATETQINIDSKYVYEDGSNSPYAVMVNNGEYLLVRNAQGDVTAVIDGANGETIAEYQYDSWGQVTITYGEDTNDLLVAIINVLCPLTYRGYNYDFTTGLYYLQSRYYNPEWGRFLNLDDTSILVASVGDPLAANMYAYCANNPVNMVDYTGRYSNTNDMINNVVMLIVVLGAIEMSCGDKIYHIFPSFNYYDIEEHKNKTSLEFLEFSYNIIGDNNGSYFEIKSTMRTEIGIVYFECEIEMRTRANWEYILNGGNIGSIYDSIVNSEEYFYFNYGISELVSGNPTAESLYNAIGIAQKIGGVLYANRKRVKYVNSELKRQKDYDNDLCCVLNKYARYQKKKFMGQIINVHYVGHDCTKEYKP